MTREVIAEYLRLRSHKLTGLSPFSDETRALRAVVRARDDLVEQRVTAHNQLEACLDAVTRKWGVAPVLSIVVLMLPGWARAR